MKNRIPCTPRISLVAPVFLLLAVLLTAWAAGSAEAASVSPPQVIASAQADFDGDGRTETLEVLLLKGRRVNDTELWCGAGDKWEGTFALKVRRGDQVLDQRAWEELFPAQDGPGDTTFFWSPLQLVTADYNGDGRPDFNLGAYSSCNLNLYRLYTLTPQGRLAELPVDGGRALAVSGAGQRNSTPLIKVAGGMLSHTYYDKARGRDVTRRYRWQDGRFVPLTGAVSQAPS